MADFVFRCYTEKLPDGQYEAVCLDLTLVDRRTTLEEAMAALDEDILGYLASVYASGDQATALPRSVRRSEWLHFYRLALQNVLLTLLGRRLDGFLAYTRKVAPHFAQDMRLVYA